MFIIYYQCYFSILYILLIGYLSNNIKILFIEYIFIILLLLMKELSPLFKLLILSYLNLFFFPLLSLLI